MTFGRVSSEPAPTKSPATVSGRWVCGCCRRPILSLRRGRGREYGEHPDHQIADCGHSATWFTPIRELVAS